MQDYIRLRSGKKFRYSQPRAEDVDIEDVAHNLAHMCRFTGATKQFYSVAEHCVVASWMAPQGLEFDCLMHDAQESLVGDVNSILKRLLPDYRRIEMSVTEVLADKFGYSHPMHPDVKEVDMRMLVTEMKQLLWPEDADELPYEPYLRTLFCWEPIRAREEFLMRFQDLTQPPYL